ncbi:hypothetical protein NDU88_002382 [Pleurodeles waltl]|uniref:Uncharacterized protein n=1 Tax=Pleurodeles waltl TaxID=8319 RepID=A0AAV7VAD2_PLEWA|nr:hypothetical protein NDU88_002382 [Pleurodeles waltl]
MASPCGGGARSLSQVGRALVRSVRLRRERAMSAILRWSFQSGTLSETLFVSSGTLASFTPSSLSLFCPEFSRRSRATGPKLSWWLRTGLEECYPELLSMSIDPALRLRLRADLLSQQQGTVLHPKPVQPPPSCMEIERQQLTAFALPPEVCKVILAARRPSTKTVYTCGWNKFVAWCTNKSVDPPSAPLSEVLLFILSLVQQGSALGTLKGPVHHFAYLLRTQHPSHEEEKLHRLDPKRALAFYLNRTKDLRVDDQLFVGYVGVKKGKAVQKRTISRWVLLCIKMCYALAQKATS